MPVIESRHSLFPQYGSSMSKVPLLFELLGQQKFDAAKISKEEQRERRKRGSGQVLSALKTYYCTGNAMEYKKK